MKNIFNLFFFALLFCSCGTLKKPYYADSVQNWENENPDSDKNKIHTLYLVGDAGELADTDKGVNLVLEAVEGAIRKELGETSLVFLGDNIYPDGLGEVNSEGRKLEEEIINAQLNLTNAHQGETFFIPGNHDWNHFSQGGRAAVIRQEQYIESFFDSGNENVNHYPDNACADPVTLQVNDELVYLFLDTQWWLQDWLQEEDMNQSCAIQSREELLHKVEEIFTNHKEQNIIVLMHHPVISNGTHGGKYNLKQHIFPLTELKPYLWFPLPVLGSIYPLYRKIKGSKQDIPHALNKELMNGLTSIANESGAQTIFATGHEHGLQYFDQGVIKYIISGAGGKQDYVKRGGAVTYARDARGYAKIDFYEDNESWLEFFTVSEEVPEAKLEFRIRL